jgi:hypothetical protein
VYQEEHLQKGRAFDQCSGHLVRSHRNSLSPKGLMNSHCQKSCPRACHLSCLHSYISRQAFFAGQRKSFFLGIEL